MKIGILTFHQASNYGALLQGYALQQTLIKLGAESQFVQIDMKRSAPQAAPVLNPFAKRIQKAKEMRDELFNLFRSQYLDISKTYPKSDDINSDFDAFIAGSDQIWNLEIPEVDMRYFLPFAEPKKCYSYAASFGSVAVPEKAKEWIAKQLSQFAQISVREEQGRALVKELSGKEAEVCLDPTLLLERSDWQKLVKPYEGKPYLLLFLLQQDAALAEKALTEAARRGLELKVVTASFIPQFGFEAWNTVGVCDWLTLIAHAGCVYTNSFHGLVFSLLFGREVSLAPLGGNLGKRNGRLEELLSLLHISPEEIAPRPVHIEEAELDRSFAVRKNESLAYLEKIIGGVS